MDFRTKKTREKYHAYREEQGLKKKKCDFCDENAVNKQWAFTYWKILKNIFPYDLIAEEHDLIVPKRHFKKESEMTAEERSELVYLKTHKLSKSKKYDFTWENFAHTRSVEHYHLHLLRFKRSK